MVSDNIQHKTHTYISSSINITLFSKQFNLFSRNPTNCGEQAFINNKRRSVLYKRLVNTEVK